MPVNLGSSYTVVASPPVSTYVTPPEVSGYLFRAGWSQPSLPYWAHFRRHSQRVRAVHVD